MGSAQASWSWSVWKTWQTEVDRILPRVIRITFATRVVQLRRVTTVTPTRPSSIRVPGKSSNRPPKSRSNLHEGTHGGVGGRGHGDHRMRRTHRADPGDHVGQLSEPLLLRPVHSCDGSGGEPGAGEEGEAAGLGTAIETGEGRLRQVDAAFAPLPDDLPSGGEVGGNPQFLGEDIDRAERNHGQPGPVESPGHIGQSVQNLIHRAVSTGSDHRFTAFPRQIRREHTRVSRSAGGEDADSGAEFRKPIPEPERLFSLGGGVEQDPDHRS